LERFWYKSIEGLLQLLFVGTLIYAFVAFVVLAKESPPADQELRLGVFSFLFLLASFLFRKLAVGEQNKPKHSVFTVALISAATFFVGMAAKLDLTGIHLIVLLVVIAIGIASAFTKNDSLSSLFKFLLGMMSGLQTERKIAKIHIQRTSDGEKAPV
jgi:FtsH-binding integral membrane protein